MSNRILRGFTYTVLVLLLAACLPEETGTFASVYDEYLVECANCHAEGALGATSNIEKSLDFSTEDTAYNTLMGSASGLSGNQSACNGVKFVVSGDPDSSLLVAVVDEDVRQAFDLASKPDCNVDSISDMTVKVGFAPSSAFLDSLKQWIASGAARSEGLGL